LGRSLFPDETWFVNALGWALFLVALAVSSFGLACLVYAYLAARFGAPVQEPMADLWNGVLP
jgi:hypothetical protein